MGRGRTDPAGKGGEGAFRRVSLLVVEKEEILSAARQYDGRNAVFLPYSPRKSSAGFDQGKKGERRLEREIFEMLQAVVVAH